MAGERVLIVDDNPTNTKLLAFVMRGCGYEVDVTHDGKSAYDSIRTRYPNIVLMDIQLPDIDGLEVVRQLRTNPATCSLLIVAITAQDDEVKAFAAGCDGYITKPIDTRTLPGTIAQYFANRTAPNQLQRQTTDERASEELCPSALDGSAERRCQLPHGHNGVHRWISSDGAKSFRWG